MKKLLFLLILFPQLLLGQYKASNGITYNVGDTISIGQGSAPNGNFLYIQMNGVVSISADNLDELCMSRQYADLEAVIKKVGVKKIAGQGKPFVTFKLGPLNYICYIELALKSGEIK